MPEVEPIGVPFDGYGRPGNQARAALALRDAGLLTAFAGRAMVDGGDLALPDPDPGRGRTTGLINEAALIAMTDALNSRVGSAVRAGRFSFVYGGDCSALLGIVTGLRDHVGDAGVVFVDGHEDTMPLDVSEDGEAANTEIGLLLGLTGRLLTGPLGDRLPALRPDRLAVLGPRDVRLSPLPEVAADPAGVVLDPVEFPAQGLPDVADEPGGLTWNQLTDLAAAMVAAGGCLGGSIAIYDADQDPRGSDAANIVSFVRTIFRSVE